MILRSFRALYTFSAAAAFGAFICITPATHADDPSVSSNKSIDKNLLNVSITGSGLPELRCITFTCIYDPQRVALMDAVISSPLPSTAFSALVDTSEKSLSVSVCATGTMHITDGATMVALRIPLTVSQEGESAFTLTSASFTDVSDTVHSVPIGSAMVARFQASAYNHAATTTPYTRCSALYLLNGRKCGFTRPRTAAGYLIRHTTGFRGKVFIR
ncbi:MAG: hypothetical protein JXA18_00475 [Chitinispirillaceae bacterium]|nr:hypothetical protein [Chitinispirillaceae bacterium]